MAIQLHSGIASNIWVLSQNNSSEIFPQLSPEDQAALEEQIREDHAREILYEAEKARREEEERKRNETELERLEEELQEIEDNIQHEWESDIQEIEGDIPHYIDEFPKQDFTSFWDYLDFFRYAINLAVLGMPTLLFAIGSVIWNIYLNASFNRMWA